MNELDKIDVLNLTIALVIGMIGMFFHYLKMWLRGQTRISLAKYLFGKGTFKSTISALLAVFGTIFTMFASNMIDIKTISGMVTVFTLGYTGDSMLNRDTEKKHRPCKNQEEATPSEDLM